MNKKFTFPILTAISWIALPCRADTSASAQLGKNVVLTVSAEGSAPFYYQWSKNASALAGATSASYVIASATAADAGVYQCTVSNSAGSTASDNATLTITPAMATLTATVTSVNYPLPVLYQWRLNGKSVVGATQATWTFDPKITVGSISLTVTYPNIPPLK